MGKGNKLKWEKCLVKILSTFNNLIQEEEGLCLIWPQALVKESFLMY